LLRYKGYEEYVPTYRTAAGKGARKVAERKLFPGYVFCRFAPLASSCIAHGMGVLTTAGVIGVVSAGRTPLSVEDQEIEAIQRALNTDLHSEPWPFLRIGQMVQIEFGPLQGVQGLLLSVQGTDRLILSVQLLQRSLAVTVERGWVSPMATVGQALADVKRGGSSNADGEFRACKTMVRD
jgi:transcription antitermination factor NusG